MPIKDLSNRLRLPRLGKIHLGLRDERGVPRATDYFVFAPEPAAPQGVMDAVRKLYGEKPRALDILFPSDDEGVIASQWYCAYGGSRGLLCRGDGERATRLIDLDTGETAIAGKDAKRTGMADIACQGTACEYYLDKRCGELMKLVFVLPKVPGIGVWQIDTGSFNSIVQVNSALHMLRGAIRHVADVPLTLVLEPREVSPDGRKKTVWVLNIRLPGLSLEQLRKTGLELPAADEPPMDAAPALSAQAEGKPAEAVRPEAAEKPALAPERPALKRVGDLFNAAKKRFDIDYKDVLKIAGVDSAAMLTDLNEAWDKVVQAMAQKGGQ